MSLQSTKSGLVLDAGKRRNLCQAERNGGAHQHFKLSHARDHFYHVQNVADGNALDLAAWNDNDGAEIINYPFHGDQNQQWGLQESSDGSWIITSACGAKRAITIPNDNIHEECDLQVWSNNGADNQRFYLQIIKGYGPLPKVFETSLHGVVVFLQNKKSGLVLDARNGRNLCLAKQNGEIYQQFQLSHVTDDVYHIQNMSDDKALDLAAGNDSDADGAKLVSDAFHGGKTQQWKCQVSESGEWIIKSVIGHNRAISMPIDSAQDETDLIIRENQGLNDQVFHMKVAGGFLSVLSTHFKSALGEVARNVQAYEKHQHLIEEALHCLPRDVLRSHSEQIHLLIMHLLNRLGEDYPSKAHPVSRNSEKWPIIVAISSILNSSFSPENLIKVPGADEFPMDVPTSSAVVSSALSLEDVKAGYYPTGFYLEAGKTLRGNVLSKSGDLMTWK